MYHNNFEIFDLLETRGNYCGILRFKTASPLTELQLRHCHAVLYLKFFLNPFSRDKFLNMHQLPPDS